MSSAVKPPVASSAAEGTLCHDCRKPAPNTNTRHTLISSSHGWRVVRGKDGAAEWRCASCWAAYKRARDQK